MFNSRKRLVRAYVGHGFKQDRDKYNHNLDIYSPTAALSSAFLFFTLAAVKKQQICVTDVTQAFLSAVVSNSMKQKLFVKSSAEGEFVVS